MTRRLLIGLLLIFLIFKWAYSYPCMDGSKDRDCKCDNNLKTCSCTKNSTREGLPCSSDAFVSLIILLKLVRIFFIKYLIIIKSHNLDISKCHCCCHSDSVNQCDAGKCGSNTYDTNAIYPGSNKACSVDSQVLKIKILFAYNRLFSQTLQNTALLHLFFLLLLII